MIMKEANISPSVIVGKNGSAIAEELWKDVEQQQKMTENGRSLANKNNMSIMSSVGIFANIYNIEISGFNMSTNCLPGSCRQS